MKSKPATTTTAAAAAAAQPRTKSSAAAENRKRQNRLSQQAHRARQASELNELRRQLKHYEQSDSERNTALAAENRELRFRLWECQKKLWSLHAKLAGIADSLTLDTDREPRGRSRSQRSDSSGPQDVGKRSVTSEQSSGPPDVGSSDDSTKAAGSSNVDLSSTTSVSWDDMALSTFTMPSADTIELGSAHAEIPSPGFHAPQADDPAESRQQIATSISFLPSPTADSILCSTLGFDMIGSADPSARHASLTFHFPTDDVQSVVSEGDRSGFTTSLRTLCGHIRAYEGALKMGLGRQGQVLDFKTILDGIEKVISTFVCLAWPCMQTWFSYTNGYHHIARLTAYRLFPGPSTLDEIAPFYKPSETQISVEHPPMIDWVLFPFLRDKLIRFHSKDPNLSKICFDILRNYVVQAKLSELVAGADPIIVTFSVWDIMTALDGAEKKSRVLPANVEVELPARSLRDLFNDARYAGVLYRHLSLHQAANICLDPSFFALYPHLYEATDCIAVGIPIRSSNPAAWSAPRSLDAVTASIYRNLALCTNGMRHVEGLTFE